MRSVRNVRERQIMELLLGNIERGLQLAVDGGEGDANVEILRTGDDLPFPTTIERRSEAGRGDVELVQGKTDRRALGVNAVDGVTLQMPIKDRAELREFEVDAVGLEIGDQHAQLRLADEVLETWCELRGECRGLAGPQQCD